MRQSNSVRTPTCWPPSMNSRRPRRPHGNALSRNRICELARLMVIELDLEAIRRLQRDLDRHIEVRPAEPATPKPGVRSRPRRSGLRMPTNELAATVRPDDPRTTNTQRRTDAPAIYLPAPPRCRACAGHRSPSRRRRSYVGPGGDQRDRRGRHRGRQRQAGISARLRSYSRRHGARDGQDRLAAPIPNAKDLGAEPHYRPSAASWTRFCPMPRSHMQLPRLRSARDPLRYPRHSVPYPWGQDASVEQLAEVSDSPPTFKTFCGWTDRQLPVGTIIWTSPSGRTNTSAPGGTQFFPNSPPQPTRSYCPTAHHRPQPPPGHANPTTHPHPRPRPPGQIRTRPKQGPLPS